MSQVSSSFSQKGLCVAATGSSKSAGSVSPLSVHYIAFLNEKPIFDSSPFTRPEADDSTSSNCVEKQRPDGAQQVSSTLTASVLATSAAKNRGHAQQETPVFVSIVGNVRHTNSAAQSSLFGATRSASNVEGISPRRAGGSSPVPPLRSTAELTMSPPAFDHRFPDIGELAPARLRELAYSSNSSLADYSLIESYFGPSVKLHIVPNRRHNGEGSSVQVIASSVFPLSTVSPTFGASVYRGAVACAFTCYDERLASGLLTHFNFIRSVLHVALEDAIGACVQFAAPEGERSPTEILRELKRGKGRLPACLRVRSMVENFIGFEAAVPVIDAALLPPPVGAASSPQWLAPRQLRAEVLKALQELQRFSPTFLSAVIAGCLSVSTVPPAVEQGNIFREEDYRDFRDVELDTVTHGGSFCGTGESVNGGNDGHGQTNLTAPHSDGHVPPSPSPSAGSDNLSSSFRTAHATRRKPELARVIIVTPDPTVARQLMLVCAFFFRPSGISFVDRSARDEWYRVLSSTAAEANAGLPYRCPHATVHAARTAALYTSFPIVWVKASSLSQARRGSYRGESRSSPAFDNTGMGDPAPLAGSPATVGAVNDLDELAHPTNAEDVNLVVNTTQLNVERIKIQRSFALDSDVRNVVACSARGPGSARDSQQQAGQFVVQAPQFSAQFSPRTSFEMEPNTTIQRHIDGALKGHGNSAHFQPLLFLESCAADYRQQAAMLKTLVRRCLASPWSVSSGGAQPKNDGESSNSAPAGGGGALPATPGSKRLPRGSEPGYLSMLGPAYTSSHLQLLTLLMDST